MIFAKVDVSLPRHHRVGRIPEKLRDAALGLWLGALCYSREQELDGFCPSHALNKATADAVVDALVAVGLLAREEQDGVHGVRVLRYSEHNETKEQISARRTKDRSRKRNLDHADSTRNPNGIQTESRRSPMGFPPQGIPDSDSDSDSDSGSGSGSGSDPEGELERDRDSGRGSGTHAAGARAVKLDDELPDGLGEAASMHGVQDIQGAWLKFCGHYAQQVIDVPGRWQAWYVNEAKRERVDRERASRPGLRRSIPADEAYCPPPKTHRPSDAEMQAEYDAKIRAVDGAT